MKYLICILTATVFLFGCKSDEIGPETPAPRIKILSFSPVENSFGNLTFEILDNPLDKDGNTFVNWSIIYTESATNRTIPSNFFPGYSVTDFANARIAGKSWEPPFPIYGLLKVGQFKIGVQYAQFGFNKKYSVKAISKTTLGKTFESETFTFTTPDFYLPKVIKVNTPDLNSSNGFRISGWFELSGVSHVGVCLSESPNVTINDKKGNEQKIVLDGIGTNSFNTSRDLYFTDFLNNLKSKTKYYYKMYAKNEKGIVFSEENSFTTL
jgi:hypothetical protein